MPSPNSTTFAGLDALWVSFVNSSGLMSGFSNITVNATSSGMRKMKAAQTMPSALAQPVRKTIPGDDRPYDQFVFSPTELPGGDVEMGTNDLALDAAAQNSTTWTLGQWLMGIYGIANPTFANLMLLGHQQAHSQDSGSVGQAGYNNILYPNCQLFPVGEDSPAFQAEGKNKYSATFLPFSTFPVGEVLDSTNFSVENGTKVKWWSRYRTLFFAKLGDATWTDIVLDYTPVNVASTKVGLTTSAGSFSLATVSSVTQSTKTVVLSAAPAAATMAVVMYEVLRLS